ncbi:putative LysR family substrate binding domain-containing protein YagP (fragment) [Mesorhizobium ventifaucium]|uniref:LysR family substrate binding domain-containing protein YagP n=1 Tax=Mesorhizobium ventifaucium TaxID=666020 RepID=A0ABN8JZY3_9HYPH
MERKELIPALEDYCPFFAGFYLYYPSRRNVAPKLRALVEHVRWRER